LKGRIDIFPIGFIAGYNILHQKFSPAEVKLLTHHPKPLMVNKNSSILFPKNHPHSSRLKKIFDRGLIALKKSKSWKSYKINLKDGKY
jgi:polar amino acid transport system substrate-binding protein